MKKDIKLKFGGLLGFFVLIMIFILLSYLVQSYSSFFEKLIVDNPFGLPIYVILNIVAIIVAPITVIPLIVVITGIWGWFILPNTPWLAVGMKL